MAMKAKGHTNPVLELKPVCDVCGGKGFVEGAVHADARYYSPNPVATRVKCYKCEGG